MEPTRRASLRRLLDTSQRDSRKEKRQRRDYWSTYGSSIKKYEEAFGDVFDHDNAHEISAFAHERRQAGKPILVFDIMSDGEAVRNLRPDGGVVIGLTDLRYLADQKTDQDKNIHFIAGNAYKQAIWQNVQHWLNRQPGEHYFHLILERAQGGMSYFPKDPTLAQAMVQHLWSVLSSDHGRLYLQVPGELKAYLEPWTELLKQQRGIAARYAFPPGSHYPIIRLDKSPQAPEELPQLISTHRSDAAYANPLHDQLAV